MIVSPNSYSPAKRPPMSVKDLLARPDIVPNPYDIAASELGTPYKAYGKAPLRKEADNSAADL